MPSVVLWMLFVLLCVEQAVCVRCYRRVDMVSGVCEEELGVAEEDDCCQNGLFGYKEEEGVCRSCGHPVWSPWSSWGACSVLCGEGARQRDRKCFGGSRPQCPNSHNNQTETELQTEPCNATLCCPGVSQWGSWGPWGACSVQCEGEGVRRRERSCSHVEPSCSATCHGHAEETHACNTHQLCPVHGAWSSWSKWGGCSASCIQWKPDGDIIYPSRTRHRSCSNPTPSSDTLPPGNSCPGDGREVQDCSELPNCPVDGGWGSWEAPGPCSVSCGEGLQLSLRRCDSPAPKYGGKLCPGLNIKTTVCQNTCPVHGDWSGWSSWGECSTSCIPPGGSSIRRRYRACTNPSPSSNPPGNNCPGDASQKENCNHLLHCPVDGGWGLWGSWTSCPVTCGIGQQLSMRTCDIPAPKHGGKLCEGLERRSKICTTNIHCPVDGVWSEWSVWGECQRGDRSIQCQKKAGSQQRQRYCHYQAHNGSICPGEDLIDIRGCYDVGNCKQFKGSWEGWSEWSLCDPSCGGNPTRSRNRICKTDFSGYPSTIGRQKKDPAIFHGTPYLPCGSLPEEEKKPCLNVPPCPHNR